MRAALPLLRTLQKTFATGQVPPRKASRRDSMPSPSSEYPLIRRPSVPSPIRPPSVISSPGSHWPEPTVSPSGDDTPLAATTGALPSPVSPEISRTYSLGKNWDSVREAFVSPETRTVRNERDRLEAIRSAEQVKRRRRAGWIMGCIAVLLAAVLACRLGVELVASVTGNPTVVISSKTELMAALKSAGIKAGDEQVKKVWAVLASGEARACQPGTRDTDSHRPRGSTGISSGRSSSLHFLED
ncbi:unnamed protein product [Ascophyllum nodosum]